jgi:hypothetical protein
MMVHPALGYIVALAVAAVIIRPSSTYRKSAMTFYMYSVRFLSESMTCMLVKARKHLYIQ